MGNALSSVYTFQRKALVYNIIIYLYIYSCKRESFDILINKEHCFVYVAFSCDGYVCFVLSCEGNFYLLS